MATSEDTAKAVYKRANYRCERCHKYLGLPVFKRGELHHCLFGRRKDDPQRDVEENLLLLDKKCHDGIGGYETKKKIWKYLCGVYGENHMLVWHESLRIKSKERFW